MSSSPSLKWRMCSWHTVVARSGPWAMPLITNAARAADALAAVVVEGDRVLALDASRSLTTSSISRNDMSGLTSGAS